MFRFLVLGALLVSSGSWAKGIVADWSCPSGSAKIPINIFYNEIGKLSFDPDIIKESMGTHSSISSCIAEFENNVNVSIKSFQNNNCSSKQDAFCSSSDTVLLKKIKEHIKQQDPAALPLIESPKIAPIKIETPEDVLQSKIASGEIDPKFLSQGFRFKGKDYKVSDFDKAVGENIENVFMKMSREEAKQYAQNYMVAKSRVLNSKSPTLSRAQVLSNLEKMFGYIHGDASDEQLKTALQCIEPGDEKIQDMNQDIDDVVAALRRQKVVSPSSCGELNSGESKVFKQDPNNFYGTGNYLLRRKPDGNYQAIINVNFEAGSGSLEPSKMMERSKRCLAEASPFMKGPNGQTLELSVLSPSETARLPKKERPEANKVKIEGPAFSSNSTAYNENADCGVITHEMLHLLGLCDEYKEDRAEFAKNKWTCRVVTKAPSIMRDVADYRRAVGGTLSCDCSSPLCITMMRHGPKNLKEIYLKPTFSEVSSAPFRSKYCKESDIPIKSISNEPNKGIVVLQESNTQLNVEARYISRFDAPPHYAVQRWAVSCKCGPRDIECQNELKSIAIRAKNSTKRNCPAGSHYVKSEAGRQGTPNALVDNILKLDMESEIPSLIQPNHFYKVLEGGCRGGKSENYQVCAAHAYKSGDEPGCEAPAECKNDNHFLGIEQ